MTCSLFSGLASAQSYSFSTVQIEGNEKIEAATILSYAGIERGQPVSAAALNDAYQRILATGLFSSVELLPQGNTLVIRVAEFATINKINFEGNKRIKDEDLAALVKSAARRVYSPASAEADAATITEAYRASGREAASVTPRIIRRPDNRVDLVFEIAEGQVVSVERLSFVGNQSFSERRLRQVLDTKQAGLLRTFVKRDTFVPERIDFDKTVLTDFYRSRGYVDFQVLSVTPQLSRERNGYFLTYTVREGQKYTFGQITASSEVAEANAADYQAIIKLRPGVTYSPSLIENTVSRMEALALKQGLQFVQIEPRVTRNDRDLKLDVNFVLVRGERIFVERIDIEGNATTLDRVVRRQFNTVEGDPFNPREIRNSAERIRALGFFSDAQVDAVQGTSPDQVIVNVDVTEQPTGSLSFGASYGVNAGFGVNVGFSESNFLGRGQTFAVSIDTASDTQNSSITFIEPSVLDRDLRFRFNTYYRVTDNDNAAYNTKRIGLTPSLEFPVSEFGRVEVRYAISEDTISGVDSTAPADDPATPDTNESLDRSSFIMEQEQGSLISSSVGYTYTRDTRRKGLNPNGGVLLRFSQDFSGLGGDTKYIITSALAGLETKVLNEEVTLTAQVEGGGIATINGSSRVTDRFFLNGKIRGFEPNGIGPRDLAVNNQDALGGNLFAVARFEAAFPIGLPEEYGITGGAFFDVGSVWSLDETGGGPAGLDPVDDGFKLRSSIGVSVFWTTPIGPLRFNFSKALMKEDYDKEQTFDLTVSTTF